MVRGVMGERKVGLVWWEVGGGVLCWSETEALYS